MNKNLIKIPSILVKYGFKHSCRLFYIYFITPIRVTIAPSLLKCYQKWNSIKCRSFLKDIEITYWKKKMDKLLKSGEHGYKLKIEELGLDKDQLHTLQNTHQASDGIVIADIDQDGFIYSPYGSIKGLPIIAKENFTKRNRFVLQIVVINGYVGVRKDYKSNKVSFLNELKALYYLGIAGCNVPTLLGIDFRNLSLTFSYILGPVLREELAKKGALLRDRDVDNNPNSLNLEKKEKQLKRIEEGKKVLHHVVDNQFVEQLFTQLQIMHSVGIIWDDIKYGNIIIEKKSAQPYIIDFDCSVFYKKIENNAFRILRDRDIEKFNLMFNREKLTYNRMVNKINEIRIDEIYAPAYLNAGLKMGNIINNESGYGRWHYILKKSLPALSGKRILDLGANNAYNAMQMLRNGAKEVIGIEINEKFISQGKFIKAGFEYFDNRLYNFQYIRASIENIPEINLGRFDLVLALCSIYYLNDESIERTTKYINSISDIFLLQCNIAKNIGRSDQHTYEKASIQYTVNILKKNGFPVIKVMKPFKYTRPIVIGKK